MKLVSFNVLHGQSLLDGRIDTARLARIVADLGADVVALQEVESGQARSGSVDQAAVVAEAMGATAWRFASAVDIDFTQRYRRVARSAVPARAGPLTARRYAATEASDRPLTPRFGVALLSKYPVVGWHGFRPPTAPVRGRLARAVRQRQVRALADEPRACLAAEIVLPSGPLVVATTHLTTLGGWNAVQLERVLAWLETLGPPVLLAGDLNMSTPPSGWRAGWRSLVVGPTFPSTDPHLQLDHVLAHGHVPATVSGAVYRLAVSDHLAIEVQLTDGVAP